MMEFYVAEASVALTLPEWLGIVISVGRSGLMAEIFSGNLLILGP